MDPLRHTKEWYQKQLDEAVEFFDDRAAECDSWEPLLWKANPDQLKSLQTSLLELRSKMVINMDQIRKAPPYPVDDTLGWEAMEHCLERVDARLNQVAKYLDIESEDSLIIQEMLEAHYSPEELGKTEAKKNGVWARLFRWLGL